MSNTIKTYHLNKLRTLRDELNNKAKEHQRKMRIPGYVNVCVEVRDYTPVHLDQLAAEVKEEERKL